MQRCFSPSTVVAKLVLLLAMPLIACAASEGDGDGDGSADDSGDAADDDAGPDGSDGADGSGATNDGADEPTDSGEPVDAEPARGIQITRVEANPGVAVPIANAGQWVGGEGRNAPIPKNRNTAFRVYVDVDEATWVTRDIEARLSVIQADGTTIEYAESVEIAGDSSETSLQSNILLGVVAEDMQPGAKFQVELYETGTGYESLPEVEQAPRAIEAGPDLIGIEGSFMNMKVVVVPIDYDFGGCTASIGAEDLQPYEDSMFQQNPLESLELVLHEPLPVSDLDLTSGNGFNQLLLRISQLRAQEQPAPNVYYYGLFDNCGQCIGDGGGCLLGVAAGIPGSSEGEAGQRVAIGTRYLQNSEVGIETFVHEIGHTQGRQHVACPGQQAGGPDVTYPYADGLIGVWGFGVRDFQIRNASNHKDYMSYCQPTWVSDWQWNATFDRIKSLSQLDGADVAPAPDVATMLVGAVDTQTGESHWWTDRGRVEASDTSTSPSRIAFVHGSAALAEIEADVDPWTEGSWVTVRANLPETAVVDLAEAFELRMPGRVARIATDRVKVFQGKGFRTR